MNTKDALDVFDNLNAFRSNPISFPPHFPEPKQLNEACDVVITCLENSQILTVESIKTLALIIHNVENEYESPVYTNSELCEKVLQQFLERK